MAGVSSRGAGPGREWIESKETNITSPALTIWVAQVEGNVALPESEVRVAGEYVRVLAECQWGAGVDRGV